MAATTPTGTPVQYSSFTATISARPAGPPRDEFRRPSAAHRSSAQMGRVKRDTYDYFGIIFDGHPALTRIEMPDDRPGHPQRKDYPPGGILVGYKAPPSCHRTRGRPTTNVTPGNGSLRWGFPGGPEQQSDVG